jgi:hypothetical protein
MLKKSKREGMGRNRSKMLTEEGTREDGGDGLTSSTPSMNMGTVSLKNLTMLISLPTCLES